MAEHILFDVRAPRGVRAAVVVFVLALRVAVERRPLAGGAADVQVSQVCVSPALAWVHHACADAESVREIHKNLSVEGMIVLQWACDPALGRVNGC